MRRRALRSLLVVVLLTSSACSGTLQFKLAIASEQLGGSIARLQRTEIQLFQSGQILSTDHAIWQQSFLKIGQSILLLNNALRNNQTGPARNEIMQVLQMLDFLSNTGLLNLSANSKLLLQGAIESVRVILVAMSTQAG